MERYQKFSDELTGKLVFNDILPLYTSESKMFKMRKIAYLYTLWPILISLRMVLLYLLVLLYNILPLNSLFITLLSVVCNAFAKTTNAKNQKIKITLNKKQIICCQLSSFIDIIIYAQKFKCYNVYYMNKNYKLNRFLLIVLFGKFEKMSTKLENQKDLKLPQTKCMIFPEETSFNQQAVIPQYFQDQDIENREIIFASIQKKSLFFPVEHCYLDLYSIINDLSPLKVKRIVKCKLSRKRDIDELQEFQGRYVTENLAQIIGSPITSNQTKYKRNEYFDIIKHEQWNEKYWDSYNGMKYSE